MNIIEWAKFHPVLFLIAFFSLLWCLMGFLVARLSGWHQLGIKYRFSGKFDGKKWTMKSIGMKSGQNYLNIITIGINRTGLYLSVFPLFRFGHPAILIPWGDTIFVKKRWMHMEHEGLSFKQAKEIFILLPADIFTLIRDKKI
ncbi:MAG: hypothetical protein PHV17_06710 [Candidatus Omnitrophica bacterium]|nr:hypothetical protein [Candidatus Omnitrophota bacterium]